jgi:excinuclease ABC subunit C
MWCLRLAKPKEQMADLIEQYYYGHETPKEVVSVTSRFSRGTSFIPRAQRHLPHEGRLLGAVEFAELNARQGLDAHFMIGPLEDDNAGLLEELGKLLGIETPYRIELFDNSHLQGS